MGVHHLYIQTHSGAIYKVFPLSFRTPGFNNKAINLFLNRLLTGFLTTELMLEVICLVGCICEGASNRQQTSYHVRGVMGNGRNLYGGVTIRRQKHGDYANRSIKVGSWYVFYFFDDFITVFTALPCENFV